MAPASCRTDSRLSYLAARLLAQATISEEPLTVDPSFSASTGSFSWPLMRLRSGRLAVVPIPNGASAAEHLKVVVDVCVLEGAVCASARM